jgi:CRISPR system Cascade subunit CasD
MHTLLLRICGPMQSWGVQSAAKDRDTGLEPSKSGVVGLLCAAQGIPRADAVTVARLAKLTMAVRIDREGVLLDDYHTAGKDGFRRANGTLEKKDVVVSTRHYLSDARFLAGLAGDDLALLAQLHAALRDPVWPLYLGRKAFVPGEPVWLEHGLLADTDLEAALKTYPWLGCDRRLWEALAQVRVVWEDPHGSEVRPDQPISFAERRFAPRRVRTGFVDKPPFKEDSPCTSPA